MRAVRRSVGLIAITLALLAAGVIIAAPSGSSARAKPPKWSKSVTDVFFADAREKVVGDRPASGSRPAAAVAGGAAVDAGGPAAAGGSFAWSKLISPETVEDEIKAQASKVIETVQAAPKFKGGGYKDARIQFSVLATMFGIVNEFDGEVRWKKQASGMRDLIGRAGNNCKVGTDASFNEAKVRKDDLESLVRGGTVEVPAGEAQANWGKVTGRPPLMSRLEQAHQQGVAIGTANAGDFNKDAEKILHEAQVIAAIAEVIQRDGFEYADDQTYLGFAKAMRQGALEVVDAVKLKNYDQARKASGDIDKACSSCHEGYRS